MTLYELEKLIVDDEVGTFDYIESTGLRVGDCRMLCAVLDMCDGTIGLDVTRKGTHTQTSIVSSRRRAVSRIFRARSGKRSRACPPATSRRPSLKSSSVTNAPSAPSSTKPPSSKSAAKTITARRGRCWRRGAEILECNMWNTVEALKSLTVFYETMERTVEDPTSTTKTWRRLWMGKDKEMENRKIKSLAHFSCHLMSSSVIEPLLQCFGRGGGASYILGAPRACHCPIWLFIPLAD